MDERHQSRREEERAPTRTYRVLRWVARTALALYYRDIEVHGQDHVPEGPLLILANHHNGMIDPMLVVATCERQVRHLAKAPLFDMPALKWIMRGVRAVPVYRQQDPGYDKEKNLGVYDAVAEALAAGGVVGIFPEGKSHTDPWVAEFKHGAARMALEAEAARDFELGLSVQLVGIQFERTRLFRGKALVTWGAPCTIDGHREAYAEDPRQTVEALTEQLHRGLRRIVVESEDLEMARLARLVERLSSESGLTIPGSSDSGAPLKDRFERRRRLLAGYRGLRETEPELMEGILASLRRYDDLLRRIGVRDTHVEQDHLWTRGLVAALLQTGRLVLGAPLALLGFALNAVPYFIVLVGVVWQTRSSDLQASTGILVATLVFPLWYILLGVLGLLSPLPWTVWLPLLAAGPVLGLFTMRWKERWRDLVASTWNLWLALRVPGIRKRLRAMRLHLLSQIEHALERAEA